MKRENHSMSPSQKEEDLKFDEFYKLHYPQKKSTASPHSRFRAKSVISITEK